MHRLGKVKIEWSPSFAYAIGLITTDGCLSSDMRHIDFTSTDKELVATLKECLGIDNKIGVKFRRRDQYKRNKWFRVQFGDTNFYEFLVSIGLNQRKSKRLGSLKIPNSYFGDFLRGCIDGDGTIGSFKHPESKQPQFRIRLVSASDDFLKWVKSKVKEVLSIEGGWIYNSGIPVLSYGKSDSIKIVRFIYRDENCPCLLRKYNVAKALWASGGTGYTRAA